MIWVKVAVSIIPADIAFTPAIHIEVTNITVQNIFIDTTDGLIQTSGSESCKTNAAYNMHI